MLFAGIAAALGGEAVTYADRLVQATQSAKERRYKDALAALDDAERLEPARYEAAALAALVFMRVNMTDPASAALESARARAPVEAKEELDRIAGLLVRVHEMMARHEADVQEAREPEPAQISAFRETLAPLQLADAIENIPARRLELDKFMEVSARYLWEWPHDVNIWELRLRVALELDRQDDGIKALRAWLGLRNVDRSDDARSLALRERAEKRGWIRIVFADSSYRSNGNLFTDRKQRHIWISAMTSEEMAAVVRAGYKSPAPANARWVNSLNMGFNFADGALMSVYETRVSDYATYMNETGQSWTWEPWQQLEHPVVNVTWEDATRFCNWLTKRERLLGRLRPNEYYRLPTDLEWGRAIGVPVESGDTPEERYDYAREKRSAWYFSWGAQPEQLSAPAGILANLGDASLIDVDPGMRVIRDYDDGFSRTAPVGSFPANALGFFDLTGNAEEWMLEFYDRGKKFYTLRGGDWLNNLTSANASVRGHAKPAITNRTIGFRCVLVTDAK